MNCVLIFFGGMSGTLIIGIVAKFIASLFVEREFTGIAAFSVAVGHVLGQNPYWSVTRSAAGLSALAVFGGVVALALLWYCLIKRTQDSHAGP